MSVPYYIGARQIAHRLGLRSPRVITRLIIRDALPVYPRRCRNISGKGWHTAYCISESALTAWELAKGQMFGVELRKRAAIKQDLADRGLTNWKKARAHEVAA
jgi:hypothetical protein